MEYGENGELDEDRGYHHAAGGQYNSDIINPTKHQRLIAFQTAAPVKQSQGTKL